VLPLGLLVGCGEKIATYHNSTNGYYIDYPSDWIASELSGGEVALNSPDSAAGIVISKLHKLPTGESMREYSLAYLEYYSEKHDDFELVSLRELSDSDYQLDYERGNTRYRNYIMLRGGWVYMITCLCYQSVFANYNYTFHQIYFSFRFTPTSHTTGKTEAVPESPTLKDWEALNRWLNDLYGIPPVRTEGQLQSAALLVSAHWFDVTDETVKELEQHGIPWERTAPICYLFNYFILYDIQLRNSSTPLEFMAADFNLAKAAQALHETAQLLVEMKLSGEPLTIFPTEEDANKRFLELDKEYVKRLEDAIRKGE
jgi:hypothetical protein